tara:strand:- start:953 stop:1183 length:231 start_codon:yes stop_codon:yes gene_type:complete
MEEVLKLIEKNGLAVVLLLGCMYALYKFFMFSIIEVKREFGKRHEKHAKDMEELKVAVSELKEKLNTILEFIKNNG